MRSPLIGKKVKYSFTDWIKMPVLFQRGEQQLYEGEGTIVDVQLNGGTTIYLIEKREGGWIRVYPEYVQPA